MREPIPNETLLVEQAVSGSTEAFEQLYVLFRDSIYRYIRARVDNDSDAEDLTSQVFLKAWEALPRYEQRDARFASWLFRIAHNLTINHLRASRHANTPLHPELAPPDEAQPAAVDRVIASEERDHLATAIRQLPEVQQRVIWLRFFEDRSHSEIAQLIAKSMGATRVIQHRALSNLNRFMQGPLSLILLLLLATSGVVLAAERAVPGDVYYPVKAVVEQTRLAAARDDVGAAELQLLFATRRLAEAEALRERERPADAATALRAYAEQLATPIATLRDPGADANARRALAARVLALEEDQRARLAALAAALPAAEAPAAEAALARWQEAVAAARALLGEEPPGASAAPPAPAASPTVAPSASPSPTAPPPSATPAPAASGAPAGMVLPATPSTSPAPPSPRPSAPPTATAPATATAPPAVAPEQPATAAPQLAPTAPPTSPPTLTPTVAPATATAPPAPTATAAPANTPAPTSTEPSGGEEAPTATPPPTPTPTATPEPSPTATATLEPPGDLPLPIVRNVVAARHTVVRRTLRAGEEAWLLIGVANGTPGELRARVVEQLPAGLEYVPGSADVEPAVSDGGRTLVWEQLAVPPQQAARLTMRVRALPVAQPTEVTLALAVTADGASVLLPGEAVTVTIQP